MADEADLAQLNTVDHNQQVLSTLSYSLLENQQKPSLLDCKDCGDPIPAQRRALGNIKFCTDCQGINDLLDSRRLKPCED